MGHIKNGMPLVLVLAACSCATNSSVAMRPVGAIAARAEPGQGTLVVIRPADACDGGTFVVTDERGRYLGESLSGSRFAASLSAGEHAIYAWDPHADAPLRRYPEVNRVAASRVVVEPGQTAYLHVGTAGGSFSLRKSCGRSRPALLGLVRQDDPQLAEWLQETRAYEADRAAGDAWLGADAAETQRHVALGASQLSSSRGDLSPGGAP